MTAVIEATDLTKRYGGIAAVDGVTFTIEADSITGIWLRWHQAGLLVAGVAIVVVSGGLASLLTWQHDWSGIGNWFATLTRVTAAGWTALGCVPLAGASYATLRRIAP